MRMWEVVEEGEEGVRGPIDDVTGSRGSHEVGRTSR